MTISLETEIVATKYDVIAGVSHYTIERGGQRWTVSVPNAEWRKVSGGRQARRDFLGKTLENAMRGKAD
jgi:hypothetical protein